MKSILLFTILISAVLLSACEKQPTGYSTQVIFVRDEYAGDTKDLEEAMSDGWEVMHNRRAFTEKSYGQVWGTEYTLRKPTYD